MHHLRTVGLVEELEVVWALELPYTGTSGESVSAYLVANPAPIGWSQGAPVIGWSRWKAHFYSPVALDPEMNG